MVGWQKHRAMWDHAVWRHVPAASGPRPTARRGGRWSTPAGSCTHMPHGTGRSSAPRVVRHRLRTETRSMSAGRHLAVTPGSPPLPDGCAPEAAADGAMLAVDPQVVVVQVAI